MSIFVSLAALRLTVAAVQLHLDLTLAVTLHGWKERCAHTLRCRCRDIQSPDTTYLLVRAIIKYAGCSLIFVSHKYSIL